ncbi:WhiB family transcriptional regulator [Streptomyces lavendulae]|uniref:WhiB family transcriptional regulator n=1 Tax=Streptomyces lavendulae TaxID=1914 RepID=UPI0033EBE8C0
MRTITSNTTPPPTLQGVSDHSWHARAACHGMDPDSADELFFHAPRDRWAIREALETCGMCPVRQECFDYALDNEEKEGIWGGMTADERLHWHEKVEHRLDYDRVLSVINGRSIQLSEHERRTLIRYAAARGWSPERLAFTLQVGLNWARDVLREEARAIEDRDNFNVALDTNPVATARQAEVDGKELPSAGVRHDGDGPERDRSKQTPEPVPRQVHTSALIDDFRKATCRPSTTNGDTAR